MQTYPHKNAILYYFKLMENLCGKHFPNIVDKDIKVENWL